MVSKWVAALVDGFTQSRKTWKAFEVLHNQINRNEKTLVLFVTQANNKAAAIQVLNRAKNHTMATLFDKMQHATRDLLNNINSINDNNWMIVDFWNARNTNIMKSVVHQATWNTIYIVFDEAEQGGKIGVRSRLQFINYIQQSTSANIKLVLITATVANLSKQIYTLAMDEKTELNHGLVGDIISKNCVEHYYATPDINYIGPSWFVENNLWRRFELPKLQSKCTRIEIMRAKQAAIDEALKELSDAQKQLCLVVTTTNKEEQHSMVHNMFDCGFNVVVEVNSDNNKNYLVHYNKNCAWAIPYIEIDALANNKCLNNICQNHTLVKTGIESSSDISLPHVLQASLFGGTDVYMNRIHKNVDQAELLKLDVLFQVISSRLPEHKRRPHEYPINPKVALIAGHIAGRGTTFQSAQLDFLCTSFCFTGTSDIAQRGASNAQRLGRACGMLGKVFHDKTRLPVLISTKNIMMDAISNERVLKDKVTTLQDGSLVSLKQFISEQDWKVAKRVCKTKIASASTTTVIKIQIPKQITPIRVMISRQEATNRLIQMIYNSPNHTCTITSKYLMAYDDDLYKYMHKYHNQLLNSLAKQELVESTVKTVWSLTATGIEYACTLSNHVGNP